LGAGLIVSPNVAEIEKALSQLTQESVRSTLSSKARDHVARNLTWDTIADRLLTLVDQEGLVRSRG
jgi:glycosyltransferase involved in cell wall biosynthesis